MKNTAFAILFAMLLPASASAAGFTGAPLATLKHGALVPDGSGEIVHTVQKNESLWQIANYFGADFDELIRQNRIDNPDLIFPGEKLIIHIQSDHSIRVLADEPAPEEEPRWAAPVAHITYPDKSEILSPENPVAEYRIEKPLVPLRQKTTETLGVFHSFVEFVEWIAAEFGFPRQTQASRTASLDLGSSISYEVSRAPDLLDRPGQGNRLADAADLYQPPRPDQAPPPPKSL